MRNYQAMYFSARRKVEASNHVVARSLAATWFKSHSDGFDERYLAVVDIDAAGYGAHTGHCQGCSPYEMCSRSGTCDWCDERYDPSNMELQCDAKKALAEHFLHGTGPCFPVNQVNETTWARIQQEELDKVHDIWSRRAGDPK